MSAKKVRGTSVFRVYTDESTLPFFSFLHFSVTTGWHSVSFHSTTSVLSIFFALCKYGREVRGYEHTLTNELYALFALH